MEYVGGAAGAALGFITDNVPGAVLGAQLGYRASLAAKNFTKNKDMAQGQKRKARPSGMPTKYQKSSKGKTMAMVQKRMGKMAKGKPKAGKAPTGTYRGRFKKPRKLVKDIKAKAGKLGWQQVLEFNGTVSDADIVYLHYNNYQKDEIFKTITGAIIRTLFREAKVDISNQEQELPLNTPIQSQFNATNAVIISFVTQDPITQTLLQTDYLIPDNATLRSVIVGIYNTPGHIGQFMNNYMTNGSFQQPYGLYMHRDVQALGRIHMASLTFENLMIEYEANSTLTVQNSTLGSGTSTDPTADRVDNQPLKGSLYHFANADPRLKQTATIGNNVLNNIDWVFSSGVTQGVAVFGGQTVFPYTIDHEPPTPRMWKNIKKSSGITLDPGNIKKTSLSNKYKNYFVELLKRFRADVFGTQQGLPIFNNVKACQSQILALEERIRTASTNLITVNWEYENRNYCIAYPKKRGETNLRGTFLGGPLAPWTPV
jgi:hypothetical protein